MKIELPRITRRDFLKLAGLSLSSLALDRFLQIGHTRPLPPEALEIVRVAVKEVAVYKEPDYESEEVDTCRRDELIYVYEKVISPHGPVRNPRWYRIDGGYIHSAHLQPVQTLLNEVSYHIPETGQLAEVTVPISLSFNYTDYQGWEPIYRLYYQSVHWVHKIGYGPNGQAWYGIRDDLLPITYYVPAPHLRLIQPEELTPLSTSIPPEKKRLLVNRSEQTVTAFENDVEIFTTRVSTGVPYNNGSKGISTITPLGNFNISAKMPVRHMGDGNITSDIEAYELPGVPWVCYFFKTGVAFHGTYWHDNYGTEMSHGCVNLKPEEAKWIYRWATPEASHSERSVLGLGTEVDVVV